VSVVVGVAGEMDNIVDDTYQDSSIHAVQGDVVGIMSFGVLPVACHSG
jgi:hypothetical protein